VDGRSIKDGDDLVNEIAGRRPGSTIRLGFVRDGKPMDAAVTIGDRDKVFAELNSPLPQVNPEGEGDAVEARLGVVVHDAPPAITEKIHASGVLVESVSTGSFADLQGVVPGLVITRVNKQPTATKGQFDAVVGKLKPGDDVVFEAIDPHHPEQGIDIIGGTL
jgi:serine protease Do